jgi:hypothetical protein
MLKIQAVLGAGVVLAGSLAITGEATAAATFNAVTAFSSSNPNGPWSYGYGDTGTNFTLYPTFISGDFGTPGLDGYTLGGTGTVPVILRNDTGSTIDFETVALPTGELLMHPGQPAAEDSILRFTAPFTGEYSAAGFFQTLDDNPNGVTIKVAEEGSGVIFQQDFTGSPASPPTPGGTLPFSNESIFLTAGQWIEVGINPDGDYTHDSTGLSLTITGVPEPTTWALMLVGFGGLGAALRMSRRKVVTAS